MSLRSSTPTLLALAVALLAGCAAGAPDNRSPASPAAHVPENGPVHAAELETQPEPIDVSGPRSWYPPEALAAGIEGTVILRILIDKTGRVTEAKVLKDPGHGLGEAAAHMAIARFRFKPGRLHDQPVSTWWTYTVVFELPPKQ